MTLKGGVISDSHRCVSFSKEKSAQKGKELTYLLNDLLSNFSLRKSSNVSKSSNIFFEAVKQFNKCENLYEFCLSERPFSNFEKTGKGVEKLADDFLYATSIFSAHFKKLDFATGGNFFNSEIERYSKVWKIIFGRKNMDAIREDDLPFQGISKYRQDIKTLFALLKKDHMKFKIRSKYYKYVKKRSEEEVKKKDKENKVNDANYKIKQYASNRRKTYNYAFKISSKNNIANFYKKKGRMVKNGPLRASRTLHVSDKPKEKKFTRKKNKKLIKLNTVELTLFLNK